MVDEDDLQQLPPPDEHAQAIVEWYVGGGSECELGDKGIRWTDKGGEIR